MSAPGSEEARRRDAALRTCSEWNACYPVDTPVLYWPTTLAPPVEAVTRSRAWVLGSDTPVVSLRRSDEKTGAACALNHVRPVARDLAAEPAPDVDPAILAAMAEIDAAVAGLDLEALRLFARVAQRIRDKAVDQAERRFAQLITDLTGVQLRTDESLSDGVERAINILVESGALAGRESDRG